MRFLTQMGKQIYGRQIVLFILSKLRLTRKVMGMLYRKRESEVTI